MKRALFYAILFIVPVFAIEVGLQAVYFLTTGDTLAHRMHMPAFQPDKDKCYAFAPNFSYVHSTPEYSINIYTNGQGFRTDEKQENFAVPKPAGVFRILLLGPSFAFGWGSEYEDAFGTLIENSLSLPDQEIELVNAGVPAQPQGMQLCWLREEGYKLEPDMIIYAHYGEPPLYHTECLTDLPCPVVEDGFVYAEEPSLKKRVINTAKKSAIVFYTWYFYQHFLPGGEADDAEGLGLELYGDIRAQLAEEDVERIADGYEEYVRNVRDYVRRPVPVAFVFIPFSFVVHPEDSARFQHRELRGPAEVAREQVLLEELGAEFDRRGVTFIDTTPPLREGRERERMYYWLDIHLTPAGNRVVAKAAVPPLQDLIGRVEAASGSCGDAGSCPAASAQRPTSGGATDGDGVLR